jgi:hypothetical protein
MGFIGLITHANTQGDIPNHIVDEMIAEAKKKHPNKKIVAIGNMDNKYVPEGVEDRRQEKGDIHWLMDTMMQVDLLLTPQTGPCFIAAGLRTPMWVYRSKEAFWDNVLNYDTYKVEKWFERDLEATYSHFDELYRNGGWNGLGSGPGSNPEQNKEYLYMLHKIIDYTPGIHTVVDIGCGDFVLMKELKHTKKYIGVDASKYIIEENKKTYPNIQFECRNIVTEELPSGDLAIVKDVLQHLPNSDITKVLEKLKKFKWVIITNDYTERNGGDISIGAWRPVNVLVEPFNVDGITLFGYIGKQVVLIRN